MLDTPAEHTSYVSTLWPLMGLEIDVAQDGTFTSENYPVIELARAGIISALGHEKIVLQKLSREFTQITLLDT
jgi:hypothetical protein